MAVSEVVGEGFLVEGALAKHHPGVPGCEGAPDHRNGGVGLAEGNSSSVSNWSSNTIAGWSRLHSELDTWNRKK